MKFNFPYKILILILLINTPVSAEYYQSQNLIPVGIQSRGLSPETNLGRTYNEHPEARVLAPKEKRYPILEQMEYLLYPNQDFSQEKPTARLERLEIAVLGARQEGNIKDRVFRIQEELQAWQIANIQTLNILQKHEDFDEKNHAYQSGSLIHRSPNQTQVQTLNQKPYHYYPYYQKNTRAEIRKPDYDWHNYRVISPLIQNIGRKSIEKLFQ
jgi:hypothetical protein